MDVFELDAAMRRIRTAMQRGDCELGNALALFLELRLFESIGFTSAADYLQRLGMSERSARDLVRVSQGCQRRSSELAAAYADGRVTWLQVLTLLAVARPANATAWIERAGEVTLRRLRDEVDWSLWRAAGSSQFSSMMPPAADDDVAGLAHDRRMCAASTDADKSSNAGSAPPPEFRDILGRIFVCFVGPAPVVTQFRRIMQDFAAPTEPRWMAFERMLEQVLATWTQQQQQHRDPVFARDGYRCTAPGCTAQFNLHDHHIVPRSQGGSDDLSNRTTLCAFHHLRGVHGGLARATGFAPEAIDWELGLQPFASSLLKLRNERYVRR